MIDYLVLGMALGLLLASIFISFFCLELFLLYRKGNSFLQRLRETQNPSRLIFGTIIVVNPTFAGVGVLCAFIFAFLEKNKPGSVLATPNILYSLSLGAIVFLFTIVGTIIFPTFKRLFLITGASTILCLGWLLPLLAQ
tara:strand:- start:197 stop:613 length:417 start_codon:yes stop_codon:yes gene_type:complete